MNELNALAEMYPLNLVEAILDQKIITSGIHFAGLLEMLNTLNPREADVLKKRFEEKMTLREIGIAHNISSERVRQIMAKALRKTRHPKKRMMFQAISLEEHEEQKRKYNKLYVEHEQLAIEYRQLLVEFEKKCKELNENYKSFIDEKNILKEIPFGEAISLLSLPIEDLDLSTRSYNCLKRAGKNTVKDLAEMSRNDFFQIKNFGRRSTEEIIQRLKEIGIIN